MANSNVEFQNMVVLAGTIKTMKQQEGGSAFLLIDVTGVEKGGPTKWVPCTLFQQVELCDRLDNYREGSPIKIRGFVRAWSQKKDNEWKNAVDIRITEIKGPDPKPAERPKSKGREPGSDDDDFASRW